MIRMRDLLSFEAALLPFFFIAAYKGSPLLEAVGERVDLTIAAMLVGVASAMIGCFLRVRQVRITPTVTRFLLAYAAFTIYALVSYQLTKSGEVAAIKVQKLLVFNTWALLAPLLFVNTPARAYRLLKLVVAVSLFFCVEAASQVVLGNALRIGALGGESYHAVGRYGGVAFLMVLVFILARGRSVRKGWLIPVAAALMGVVLLSMTRHAVVGIVGAVLFLAAMKSRGERGLGPLFRYGAALLVIVAFATTLGLYFAGDVDLDRFQRRMTVLTGDQASIQEMERVTIYRASLEVWLDNPLFGVGFGGFQEASGLPFRQSHNLILELLCELGVVGCALFALVLWFPASAVWRRSRREMTRESTAIAVAGVFFFTCAMFSGDVTDNRHILIFAGLAMANEASLRRAAARLARGAEAGRQQSGRHPGLRPIAPGVA